MTPTDPRSEATLRPCPDCGGNDLQLTTLPGSDKPWIVSCAECGVRMSSGPSQEMARIAWNAAYCWKEIDRLQAENAELKQLIENYETDGGLQTANLRKVCADLAKEKFEREEMYQAFQKWKKDYFTDLQAAKGEIEKLRANTDKAVCMYCGHVGPKLSDEIRAHIAGCVKHPINGMAHSLAEAGRRISDLEGALKRYGTHWNTCATEKEIHSGPCSCGLESILHPTPTEERGKENG